MAVTIEFGDEGPELSEQPAQIVTCQHCARRIEWDHIDGWIDPEATGDDWIWRETCDEHDTFDARHQPTEPDEGWTDEQLEADDAAAYARAHADDPQPETGTPFPRKRPRPRVWASTSTEEATMHTRTTRELVIEHNDVEFALPWIGESIHDPIVTEHAGRLHVSYFVLDDDCSNPWEDNDGLTYKLFDNGRERDRWVDEFHEDPDAEIAAAMAEHRFFWLERYEHGLVRYALTNESSQVDRQWDVASGVGWIMLDRDWYGGDGTPEQFVEIARSFCDEYTDWCNGDCYGVVNAEIDLDTGETIDEPDACWGYIGFEHAQSEALAHHAWVTRDDR